MSPAVMSASRAAQAAAPSAAMMPQARAATRPSLARAHAGPFLASSSSKSMWGTRVAHCERATRISLAAPAAASVLYVKDDSSGVEYPMVTRLWAGDEYRSLGAGVRAKKVILFNVNVYALTVYVEAEKAAHELGVRYRGGFFETEQDFCDAIMDGAFGKAIQLTILRSNVGEQIADAIEEAIAPRMRLMQQTAVLDEFIGYFKQRGESVDKGANVMLFFTQGGTVNISIKSGGGEVSGGEVNWLAGVPEKSIESPALCRALLEVWLGESSVVPNAKPTIAAGAKALLESDNIRRQTRKGGS